MDALDLPLSGESLQITPGGGFADRKCLTELRDADTLAAKDELYDQVLTFETGD